MTVILAAIEEGIAIGAIFRRRVELASFAIARRAVSLDVAQMGCGLAAAAWGANRPGFDDHAPAAGFAMTPAIRQVAGAHEGCASPALHAAAGRDDAPTIRRPAETSTLGGRASAGPGQLLAGDLANLAEETLGLSGLCSVGADAAGLRPEVIVVAHSR
ncbi:MAG: hypothetical protein E6R12_01970 [Sphingomonadales bacterium]|nr:MAG: hypothetical protein E6R12_01970 [Sphingomonadales bacterium]